MTRRQLLKAFGAVGGSSLMMGTMNAWGLMGPSAGTRPVLQGRQPGTRVIVLGAGMSGLTVGYELGKLGYDYRILEAREWVGGLCWTIRAPRSPKSLRGSPPSASTVKMSRSDDPSSLVTAELKRIDSPSRAKIG